MTSLFCLQWLVCDTIVKTTTYVASAPPENKQRLDSVRDQREHHYKKNVFKGVTTSKDLAAVFSDQFIEVETRELFAQEFAGPLKNILNHMEHNGGMAADNVFAGAPIRTQTGGMTHLQR